LGHIEGPVLKIKRSTGDRVVFRLSGRIESDDVAELRRLFGLEKVDHHIALDLEDVTLVDREGVAFLARCERDGIELENCPAYVREWLEKERGRNPRRKQ
jgi:hypothetical protein